MRTELSTGQATPPRTSAGPNGAAALGVIVPGPTLGERGSGVGASQRPGSLAAAAPHRASRRMDLALLVGALMGGATLRLVKLGVVGLNSDEAVYAAQAAALAGNPHFTALFPVVRAHPLLFQIAISPWYAHGVSDIPGRYLAALCGVGTIALTYLAGRLLFGPLCGGFAAVLVAVMPYHVIISRQIILDGPMTLCATAALVALAAAGRTAAGRYLIAAGAALGVAALVKESAVVMVAAAAAWVALTRALWRPLRYPLISLALSLTLVAAYPLMTTISGGSQGGRSYLTWQLTRPPNHTATFFPTVVGGAMGIVTLAVAAGGLLLFFRWTWRERLLLSWIAVPTAFFEIWPTKGYSYLLPLAPAVALLAGRTIVLLATGGTSHAHAGAAGGDRPRRRGSMAAGGPARMGVAAALLVACTVTLAASAVGETFRSDNSGLAATGGTPGGREVGQWVADNLPVNAAMMTIGPSMANIIQFYSGQRADGLSVSPNPLHRNPAYQTIGNADAALRDGTYQYLVWDAYSASRSPTFAARMDTLVSRFDGRLIHVQRGTFQGRDDQVLIAVYQVTRRVTAARQATAHAAITQPSSAVLYTGYGVAFVIAVGAAGWAVATERSRRTAARRGAVDGRAAP